VKPTATSAYIMPSMSPFMTYWASSPASIRQARYQIVPAKAGTQDHGSCGNARSMVSRPG
jgi:hypothetical protein